MRNGVKQVIFDLDGTLVDSVPDLAYSVNRVLQKFSCPKQDIATIKSHMGNGMHKLLNAVFTEAIGDEISAIDIEKAFELFLQYYGEDFTSRSSLYPNVVKTLSKLQDENIKLVCVTNKLGKFTYPIIEYFEMHHYFSLVLSGDTLERKKPDPLPLAYACAKLNTHVEECVMVGDSHVDLNAANNAGMKSMYMSYGYGDNNEAVSLKPNYTSDNIEYVLNII